MGKRVSDHVRGNVVGYVALFMAMSLGTAYAVERNEIKSKHIAKNAVKSSDVAPDTLTGADVQESSLELPASNAPPQELPTSLPPNGPAGGDLAGSYPDPSLAADAVGAGEVDGSQVQRRVSGSCGPGQFFTGVAQDGAATCTSEPGDISAITAGTGLSGGAAAGSASLGIATDGVGSAEVDDDELQIEDITVARLRNQGISVFTPPGIDANTCSVINPVVPGVTVGDLVLVIPRVITDGWTMQGGVATSTNVPPVQICNHTEQDDMGGFATYDVLAFGG